MPSEILYPDWVTHEDPTGKLGYLASRQPPQEEKPVAKKPDSKKSNSVRPDDKRHK